MTAGAPQLRPLGIGEVLDVALKIVWRNAGTLVRVVVFVVLPVQVVTTLLIVSARPNDNSGFVFGSDTGRQISSDDVRALVVATLGAGILGFLGSTLASGACFRAIASAYLGERTSWIESLRFALRHLHSIVWITFLAGLASGLGLILCILPGVYLWVGFSLSVPVLLTERRKGGKALGRSRELVRGFWWRTFAVTALGYVLSAILGGAIQGAVAGAAGFGSRSTSVTYVVLTIVAGTVSKVVTTPFIAAFVTVLYFDLRVRKEGFDLQLLAERIGVDAPAGWTLPPAPAEIGAGDKPPFWPPPPGWKPGGGGS